MEITGGESLEIKTLGDAWKVFERHGLEGKYCPHCDQFAQARVLQRQDELITDMYQALKELQGTCSATYEHTLTITYVEDIVGKALAKADRRE